MSDVVWDDEKPHDGVVWDDAHAGPEAPQQAVSKTESAVRGAGQGITGGFSDEATGGIQAIVKGLMDDKPMSLAKLKSDYQITRDGERKDNTAARRANPKTYTAGEIAGGVASAPLIPGGAPSTLGKAALQGAAVGGVGALGNSDADLTKGQGREAYNDVKQGAGIGALAGIGGKYAGDKVSQFANWLKGKKVDATNQIENEINARVFKDNETKKAYQANERRDKFIKPARDVEDAVLNGQIGLPPESLENSKSVLEPFRGRQAETLNQNLADAGGAVPEITGLTPEGTQLLRGQYSQEIRNAPFSEAKTLAKQGLWKMAKSVPFVEGIADLGHAAVRGVNLNRPATAETVFGTLSKAGETGVKYYPLLKNALQRGGAEGFAAAHKTLMETNPKYQALMNQQNNPDLAK